MPLLHEKISGQTCTAPTVTDFFRFPHTPHIEWMSRGQPRGDKVLSPAEAASFVAGEVVVEEKLDGANLGFSVGPDGALRAQNRGQYLLRPFTGQFSRLDDWLAVHEDRLFDSLTESLIVFGEWCAARHSLGYDRLPDWWLVFDVYDRGAQRFWSTTRRNQLADLMRSAEVPCLYSGHVSLARLRGLVTNQLSRFGETPIEGVIVRREDAQWLHERAKLVRADFTQAITQHWRAGSLQWNRVCKTAHD